MVFFLLSHFLDQDTGYRKRYAGYSLPDSESRFHSTVIGGNSKDTGERGN
jgi:hypothetical protein